ncbi:MAG: hypothetical protein ABI221_00195 [Candidatus Saccharimonadales bacterium]
MDMKYSLKYKMASFARSKGYDFKESSRPEVIAMQKDINSLKNKNVDFAIETYPDGSWSAKATNIKGMLTGSRKQDEINELIKDAIFTHYGIPARYANDRLLKNTGESVLAERQVHVTT